MSQSAGIAKVGERRQGLLPRQKRIPQMPVKGKPTGPADTSRTRLMEFLEE